MNSVLSLVDPLINSILTVFVERAGSDEGFRAFKIFLATVPIFFGVLAFALCMLLPGRGDNNENKERERRHQHKGDVFNFCHLYLIFIVVIVSCLAPAPTSPAKHL